MVFRKVNWKEFIIKWMASEMERSSVTIRIQIQEIEKMVTLLIKKRKIWKWILRKRCKYSSSSVTLALSHSL